jgi:hypothetical protein
MEIIELLIVLPLITPYTIEKTYYRYSVVPNIFRQIYKEIKITF